MYIIWMGGNHGGFTLHTKSISSAKSGLSRTPVQSTENLPKKPNSSSANGSMYVGHTGPVGEFRVRRATCCTFRTWAMPSRYMFSRYPCHVVSIPTYTFCLIGDADEMYVSNLVLIWGFFMHATRSSMGSVPMVLTFAVETLWPVL